MSDRELEEILNGYGQTIKDLPFGDTEHIIERMAEALIRARMHMSCLDCLRAPECYQTKGFPITLCEDFRLNSVKHPELSPEVRL